MFFNTIKTIILLSSLSGLLLILGHLFGGATGVQMALIMAVVMNGISYFFSDRIVLNMYKAKPLDKNAYADVYLMVRELSNALAIPTPKLWLINSPAANAFATGRNPSHASVALTTGIMNILDPQEMRAVLAHELGHVKNKDILISTIAAMLASAIGYLGYFLQRAAFWNVFSGNNKQRNNNPLGLFLMSILMPIAATLIQLALSRSREYGADYTGACCTRDPLSLASALKKLEQSTHNTHFNENPQHASTASLFIVYPFFGKNLTSLFATHPPIASRVARLEEMHRKMFS